MQATNAAYRVRSKQNTNGESKLIYTLAAFGRYEDRSGPMFCSTMILDSIDDPDPPQPIPLQVYVLLPSRIVDEPSLPWPEAVTFSISKRGKTL